MVTNRQQVVAWRWFCWRLWIRSVQTVFMCVLTVVQLKHM